MADECESEPNPKVVGPDGMPGEFYVSYAPTVWLTANFAPRWYADAKNEANQTGDDARRREIVFAVAFVESYLFEWVRDVVLSGEFAKLNDYFPPGETRPVRDRVKDVLADLARDNELKQKPDWRQPEFRWSDFCLLVDFRNGLVHGAASRPDTAGLPKGEKPNPGSIELQEINPGWPTKVAHDLFSSLLKLYGRELPTWLIDPDPRP